MREEPRYGSPVHSQAMVRDPDAYTLPTDGKGKGRPAARVKWLVGLENLPTPPTPPAGGVALFPNGVSTRSAIAARIARISAHDDARRRSSDPAGAHPARQP